MQAIENVVAAEGIFAAMDLEDGTDPASMHSQTTGSLTYLTRALPACEAAVLVHHLADNVASPTAEEKFVVAFADFAKELPREDAEHGGALSQRLHAFKTKHLVEFESMLREAINQLKQL